MRYPNGAREVAFRTGRRPVSSPNPARSQIYYDSGAMECVKLPGGLQKFPILPNGKPEVGEHAVVLLHLVENVWIFGRKSCSPPFAPKVMTPEMTSGRLGKMVDMSAPPGTFPRFDRMPNRSKTILFVRHPIPVPGFPFILTTGHSPCHGAEGGTRTTTGFPNMPEAESSSASPQANHGKSLGSDPAPTAIPPYATPGS